MASQGARLSHQAIGNLPLVDAARNPDTFDVLTAKRLRKEVDDFPFVPFAIAWRRSWVCAKPEHVSSQLLRVLAWNVSLLAP
jgi:hypothetical protein